jgi:hypothetical protein
MQPSLSRTIANEASLSHLYHVRLIAAIVTLIDQVEGL